jgi:hypothetical protein
MRRKGDGTWTITTNPGGNKTRLSIQVPFDAVNDLVYRQLTDPVHGELDINLNGKRVLSYRGPLSDSKPGNGYYPCYGIYYGSGMAGTIVHEVANIAPPSLAELSARISNAPAW